MEMSDTVSICVVWEGLFYFSFVTAVLQMQNLSFFVQDMLLKMPGISSKNVYTVMNRVENLTQLVKLSLAELTEVLDSSSNAKLLHDFIHSSNQLPQTDVSAAASKVATGAGKPKPPVRRKSPKKK